MASEHQHFDSGMETSFKISKFDKKLTFTEFVLGKLTKKMAPNFEYSQHKLRILWKWPQNINILTLEWRRHTKFQNLTKLSTLTSLCSGPVRAQTLRLCIASAQTPNIMKMVSEHQQCGPEMEPPYKFFIFSKLSTLPSLCSGPGRAQTLQIWHIPAQTPQIQNLESDFNSEHRGGPATFT